jgi:ubiquinone/menaquinone biosynthesis C-methylase UbiE
MSFVVSLQLYPGKSSMANIVRRTYRRMAELINISASRFSYDRRVTSMLTGIIDLGKELRVLDAGCGIGKYSKLFGGMLYVGVDRGDYRFRRDLIEHSSFCRASVLDLPFEDETFDIVFSSFMIEHVQDMDGALVSMYRVLKRGGLVLISTGSRWARPLGEMHAIFWKEEDESIGQAHHYFSVRELEKLLDGAGFGEIEIQRVGGPFAFLSDFFRTFFRLLGMKMTGRRYMHGRNSDETGKQSPQKRSSIPRMVRAAWVVVQFPVRRLYYEISYWLDRLLCRVGGARFLVVTARKSTEREPMNRFLV